MYVCVCNGVSERAIREAVEGGVRTYDELQARTGCGTSCGCCEPVAIQVMEQCMRAGNANPVSLASPAFETLAISSGR